MQLLAGVFALWPGPDFTPPPIAPVVVAATAEADSDEDPCMLEFKTLTVG